MEHRLPVSIVLGIAVSIGVLRPTALEGTAAASHGRHEIVFVDETVEDYRALLTGIDASVETVLLDGRRDGLEQIAQELAGRGLFDAVHVISHGRQAELQLGRATLTRDSIRSEYADELGAIRRNLLEGADILIYGCNFGEGTSGREAVALVAELTGADVAASDGLTGAESRGGDWDLEVVTESIETDVVVTARAQAGWSAVLDSVTVTTNADVLDGDADTSSIAALKITPGADGLISLREAIVAANTSVGVADTIDLPANTYTLTIAGIDENAAATGDLDITDDLTITGAGAATTILDGNGADRIFHLDLVGNVSLSGMTIQGGDVRSGAVDQGGGIRIDSGPLTMTNVVVSGNFAGSGGGIEDEVGGITATDVEISGNTASSGGGGGYRVPAPSTASTFTRVLFANNTSAGNGAGVYLDGTSDTTFTNTTFSGNNSNDDGGGIYMGGDVLTLTNVTVTGNSTTTQGGGIAIQNGNRTIDLVNTIFINNTAPVGPDVNGTVDTTSNNWVGNSATSSGFGASDFLDLPGLSLGALADNGGFTRTHELLSGSRGIDEGTNTGAPGDDQRGFLRSDGSVDIGAYESAKSYEFRKRVIIDRGQISDPSCGTTLANFPMLFNGVDPDLRHTGFGGDVTDLEGDDIIFQAFDTTTCGGPTFCTLDHEIERYNLATGELIAWVRLPSVNTSAAASDTVIYLTYANSTVTSPTENPTAVWDSNFKAVYHLGEPVVDEGSAVDAHVDSSGTNNHGDQNGNTSIAGRVGLGQDLDSNDFILGTTTGFVTTGGSIAFWFRGNWAGGDNQVHDLYTMIVTDWDTNAMMVKKHSTNEFQWFVADDSPNDYRLRTINPVTWPAGEWHHVTATWDAALNVEMYIDAVRITTPWWDVGTPGLPTAIAPTFRLGNTNPDARVDEFQYSDIARDACWITASYNNQAWPDKAQTPTPDPTPNPSEGFYGLGVATAVELVSLTARGLNRSVELSWETGSELDNLGFHLYRASSENGPWERMTGSLIPGLGSSPEGARYRYVDASVMNGATYFYALEDVETTGATERHGPVWATPAAGVEDVPASEEESDVSARLTYGDPEANVFRMRPRRNGVVLELETHGFVAVAQEDGSVRLEVPGLEEFLGSSLPVKREWVEAIAGKDVKVASSRAREVVRFAGLHPSASLERDVEATPAGTVRARVRRRGRRLLQREGAKLVEVGYQGDTKKALVELSPFAWDGAGLVVARKLEVYVAFRGREAGQRARANAGTASVRLVAKERGLYGVALTELFGLRRASKVRALRLSRQGEDVAYHVESGMLYFWSEGARANPYGNEAVYELEVGVAGERMEVVEASPGTSAYYMETLELEENRYYQSTLVDAPDSWLWEVLFAPARKSFPFEVNELSSEPVASSLEVSLQGTSDFPGVEDHHVRVFVNGNYAGEGRWDGKTAHRLDVELGPGILREGENTLELESLSDTGAAYAMMMLDRFRVRYPRHTAVLASARHVIELTESSPRWVAPGTGFEAGGRYVGVDEVLRPERRSVASSRLRKKRRADYVVIGPKALVEAAKPLLRHRRRQGLRTVTASTEAIASEFGHGELTPHAIRDFIGYAYHEWREPRLRYVLLLGDATFDFKNYLGTDVTNQVPPFIVRTSYLWTASDPAYAAVNGDDAMPDVAIGRLPAKSSEELRAMVAKILAYERGERAEHAEQAPFVLVADNADAAGNFERDADELASTLLAGRETNKIYLSQLGTSAARDAIVESFDRGASTMSYLGHGAIHFWADENLFNNARVETLSPHGQQPLVLTMNCLNGYFHFPYFDSLAEALVKQPGKGAIAAFSPSGLSLNGPAHRYHRALLEQLVSARHGRLGDAVLAAQKQYADTGAFPELLSIYHLFGDPALTLR